MKAPRFKPDFSDYLVGQWEEKGFVFYLRTQPLKFGPYPDQAAAQKAFDALLAASGKRSKRALPQALRAKQLARELCTSGKRPMLTEKWIAWAARKILRFSKERSR